MVENINDGESARKLIEDAIKCFEQDSGLFIRRVVIEKETAPGHPYGLPTSRLRISIDTELP